jgi:MoaA/NifB/PqqE/SkfB family radical SAM enzyme
MTRNLPDSGELEQDDLQIIHQFFLYSQDPGNIERLIDSPLHNINVSLDAATPDTYRKIRGADFNAVLNNIRNFVHIRDQLGSKAPLLYLNMTLMRANIEELPLFIELVSQLKGDRAYFFHMADDVNREN